MNPDWVNINYFKLQADEKDFVQRMVYLDFMEEIEDCQFRGLPCQTLEGIINEARDEYEWDEDYETCKLLQDILIRFKKDINRFDN